MMTKSRAPAKGSDYPENGLVKPPKCDSRALSPAGMFGGKVPLRLAAQKSRLHAKSVPVRSASQVNSLQSKEQNPQQAEQVHAQMQQYV